MSICELYKSIYWSVSLLVHVGWLVGKSVIVHKNNVKYHEKAILELEAISNTTTIN